MLKRVFTLFLTITALCAAFSVSAAIPASAVTSDVATITFDTEAAIANFYSAGDLDVVLSVTDEFAFTGRCLKISLTVPDQRSHEGRILFDAGSLKFANLNNCTIEAHVLFPTNAEKTWGPGTQSLALIATDPSWIETRSDPKLFGAWQTVTLKCGSNDNNKSFGFSFPIAPNNAGEVVCYIDDIRVIKDEAVVESIDMDPSFVYPMPTDTATFATTAAPEIDTASEEDTEEVKTTPTVVVPTGDPHSKSSLIIILVVTFVIIAAIAGIIYFFVWKSKNKYY